MAVLLLLISIITALSFVFTLSKNATEPDFAFSWLDDKDTFKAGDIATIRIKVLNNFDKLDKNAFKPILSVNGKLGNSSYVSGVLTDFEGDPGNWKLFFTTITSGLFNVIIEDHQYEVFDSSLHFQVEPGKIYPSVCVASWVASVNEFEAGSKARIMILAKDAFGNNITSTGEDPNLYNFTVSVFYTNDSIASVPYISYVGWNEFGNIVLEFVVVIAGNQFLKVNAGNQTLNRSPLPFNVNPGPLEISNCVAKWNYEPNAWQLLSKMEIFINQQDQYGNLVPGLYPFDAEVIEKETNLSIPVADLHFEEVQAGIQLFSFSNTEPGNFLLTISDMKHKKSISNMPYAYTVFVGYCNGSNSIVNGSGLNSSIAGEMAQFSVYLNDVYQLPSPVEVERLQVEIVKDMDSYSVQPAIYPIQIVNESTSTRGLGYGINGEIQMAPAPSFDPENYSTGGSRIVANAFNVVYTPLKSGIYGILVSCGNIVLNGGRSFMKEVRAGEVNISLSRVVKFAAKGPKMIMNEVEVQLMDSFSNPVFSQQSRLKLEMVSSNSSGFSSRMFVDNNDGSYTGHYLVEGIGTHEICASFDSNRLPPCPFVVNVYSGEYFPIAYNDNISVWEDESIAFDSLKNDYFSGGNASILNFTQPIHGSLLQYGRLFRYTPWKDYYGNDDFEYTISDINGNLASVAVNISVLTIPPQFVSFPSELHATEDEICPRFGGFSGFEIRYSDTMENISVNLSAISGTVLLSPMLMQFWSPWSGFSAYRRDGEANNLVLEGSVEAVNFGLKSIQYVGNENFYGNDIVRVSMRNRNGVNNLDIPVIVEAINDPPFINVPELIILKSNEDDTLIYDEKRDKFEFFIGDPDLHGFPGSESLFRVTFSMEVNDGFLETSLPSELINTTELKIMNSNQWQPLQTYVAISKHFMVKANGVRFRGTISDCNAVMKQLFYEGGEHGAVLTVTVNDIGNHGCYPDCAEKISVPLYTEASINLIRRRPINSVLAHALGSAIIIEFIVLFFLGLLLLFFMCKCAILLVHDRRNNSRIRVSEQTSLHNSHNETELSTLK